MKRILFVITLVATASGIASAIPINVTASANGGFASQSSTLGGDVASKANYGNTEGNYFSGSVQHTSFEANAWWQVVFNQQYAISQIEVFNRTDCCLSRISPFSVFLYTNAADTTPVWSMTGITMDLDNQESFAPPNVVAEKLRVQLDGSEYLHMAEVQAFGEEAVSVATPEPGRLVLTLSAIGAVVLRRSNYLRLRAR